MVPTFPISLSTNPLINYALNPTHRRNNSPFNGMNPSCSIQQPVVVVPPVMAFSTGIRLFRCYHRLSLTPAVAVPGIRWGVSEQRFLSSRSVRPIKARRREVTEEIGENGNGSVIASDGSGGEGRIVATELHKEATEAYMSYAMSVLLGRALPDVRDGLKPVHRRIL